jgi:hypothetical protein
VFRIYEIKINMPLSRARAACAALAEFTARRTPGVRNKTRQQIIANASQRSLRSQLARIGN